MNIKTALRTLLASLALAGVATVSIAQSPQPFGHQAGPMGVSPAPQPADFLVGRWQVKGQLPMGERGPTDGELLMTYSPDGSFTMVGQYRLPLPETGIVPIDVNMAGRWTINGASGPDRISLFLNGQMTMLLPAQFNTPPQHDSVADNETLRIIDANTVIDSSNLTWRRI